MGATQRDMLDVRPGEGVGPFKLGQPLGSVIAHLDANKATFTRVELQYNESQPYSMPVELRVLSHGLRLSFDAESQRLVAIAAVDLQTAPLAYSGGKFSGGEAASNAVASFVRVYNLFGPTYPGSVEGSDYELHYRGISFCFPVPEKYLGIYRNDPNEMPLELPDGSTPVARSMHVFSGHTRHDPKPITLGPSDYYHEPVDAHVDVARGSAVLQFTRRDRTLSFTSSVQHVLSELGPPNRTFYKDNNKMAIHAGKATTRSADYFLNYHSLGLDVMVCGETHTVRKFVVHTNLPGHTLFNRYAKCNVHMHVAGAGGACITAASPWADVLAVLGEPSRPMVNKGIQSAHPFGDTYFYAFKGIIFEVTKAKAIATITLFAT